MQHRPDGGLSIVLDEQAVRRVLALYCHRCDDADFDGVADLFTENGTFTFGDDVATGRSDISAYLARMQPPTRRGKHVTVNAVIDIIGDQAKVLADFLFLRPKDGAFRVQLVGRYRDVFVRTDAGWLIERRAADLWGPPAPGKGSP